MVVVFVVGIIGNGGVSQVLIDGKLFEVGQIYEILLIEECVQVMCQVVLLSEVVVCCQVQVIIYEEIVILCCEEFEVFDEQGLVCIVDEGVVEGIVIGVNIMGID